MLHHPQRRHPLYTGASASRVYDARFELRALDRHPAGLLDNRYVPQGMAAWTNWNGNGEDIALISAYHDGNGNKEPDGPQRHLRRGGQR